MTGAAPRSADTGTDLLSVPPAPLGRRTGLCQCPPCCGGGDLIMCGNDADGGDLLCSTCRNPRMPEALRWWQNGWCGHCHVDTERLRCCTP